MATHGVFRWMQDYADALKSSSDSMAIEANTLNDSGDEPAAIRKLEQSILRGREASDLQFEILKVPGYVQWRTLSLAAGVELTGEFVDRMAASAAVKRGLTLRDLNELPAEEVAVMVAADAAVPARAANMAESQTSKPKPKSVATPTDEQLECARKTFRQDPKATKDTIRLNCLCGSTIATKIIQQMRAEGLCKSLPRREK